VTTLDVGGELEASLPCPNFKCASDGEPTAVEIVETYDHDALMARCTCCGDLFIALSDEQPIPPLLFVEASAAPTSTSRSSHDVEEDDW
jgi:hypothetical protein